MPTHKKGSTTYSEYVVKAGETVQQIAREQLHDERRFKEIKLWKDNNFNEIATALQAGWIVLVPVLDDPSLKFRNTTLGGDRVLGGPGLNYPQLYLAPINTEFQYKKSSLTKDASGNLWARVTSVGKPEGFFCVKQGNSHFTSPLIDG